MMNAARDFFAPGRIAVVGVSRNSGEAANFIFRKLRDSGHEVIPVYPHAGQLEDAPCYPTLGTILEKADAVVICTPPLATTDIVRDAADLGITHLWIPRAFGTGSFAQEALVVAQERNLTLIAGGCPAMFCTRVDVPHRCMRWLPDPTGRLPRNVDTEAVAAQTAPQD